MSKRTFVGVLVVALAVVVMAGGLLASNMGFKLNYRLLAADGGVLSKNGTSTLALPDNRQSTLTTAADLCADIGSVRVQSIQRFDKVTGGLPQKVCAIPGIGFALAPGDGLYVKMNTTTDYIVVGSDNPTQAYTLNGQAVGVSKAGDNFFAYNYHQTAATAKTLCQDIAGGVTSIQTYVKATNGLSQFLCALPGPGFSLVPGEAYWVKMPVGAVVAYVPSHY